MCITKNPHFFIFFAILSNNTMTHKVVAETKMVVKQYTGHTLFFNLELALSQIGNSIECNMYHVKLLC